MTRQPPTPPPALTDAQLAALTDAELELAVAAAATAHRYAEIERDNLAAEIERDNLADVRLTRAAQRVRRRRRSVPLPGGERVPLDADDAARETNPHVIAKDDPEALALLHEADELLGVKSDPLDPDSYLGEQPTPGEPFGLEWESILNEPEDVIEGEADPFAGIAHRDVGRRYGSGYKTARSVASERPDAVGALEEESRYLIEQPGAVVRIGETPGADLAADAALNRALYRIRDPARHARRPTRAALAKALGCSAKTIDRRVARGRELELAAAV
jgi:hypothetical protein